jgi:hypothetical protein
VAWLRSILSGQPVLCFRQPVRLDDPALCTNIHCVAGVPEGIERRPVPETGRDFVITMPAELTELLVKLG